MQFVTHYAESSLCDQTGLILTRLKQTLNENSLDPQASSTPDFGLSHLCASLCFRDEGEKER